VSAPVVAVAEGEDMWREGIAAECEAPLYPLRFEPLYQYRPWGGRNLADLLRAALPGEGPVGEAWVLSDRPEHQSRVVDGPLTGHTLRQLVELFPQELMGRNALPFGRFPLLLKFLDAHDLLSVQVHPSDANTQYLPAGETAKTEAWVVLAAGPESRVYAGLQPGASPEGLRRAIDSTTLQDQLASFVPRVGDAVFLPAGTVHALGGDVVVFEVQQNSDVTFRLYDWDHIDARTGQRRALQVDEALACTSFDQGPLGPVVAVTESTSPVQRERLFDCQYFRVWRLRGEVPFAVGARGAPRVLVCIEGSGRVEHGGATYALSRGDVVLLPAVVEQGRSER
jgi:mannose-6-phosphate isomerase